MITAPSAIDPTIEGRSFSARRMPATLAVALGALLLVGAVVGALAYRDSGVAAGELPARTAVAASPQPAATLRPAEPGPPLRLRLSALGIDAQVDPVSVAGDGTLGVPDDVHRLGWWDGGAMAGATAGTVVIDGHVDSSASGAGALFRLAQTPLGSIIDVTTADRTVRYVVHARRAYPKAALPPEVFSDTSAPRLVLITCGGSFNKTRGHYTDNIVIYATMS